MRGDGFEWDDRKAIKNVRAHGITFEEGSTVYHDRNRVELYDLSHSELEERMIVIGYSAATRLLMVVTTERHEAIRIISERRANNQEAERYFASR